MTYLEQYNMRVTEEYRKRVLMAAAHVARDIIAEDAGTTNHANRMLWAARIVSEDIYTQGMHTLMSHVGGNWLALQEGVAITDADLKNVVSAVVNTMADGVYGA